MNEETVQITVRLLLSQLPVWVMGEAELRQQTRTVSLTYTSLYGKA